MLSLRRKVNGKSESLNVVSFWKRNLTAYLLILPACAFIFIVLVYPLVYSLILSFGSLPSFDQPMEFVGLKNYRGLINQYGFWQTVRQTLVWTTGNVIFQFLLGLFAALLVNRTRIGKAVGLSILLVPWVSTYVVTAIVWRLIFDSQLGMLNDVLIRLGFIKDALNWLGDPKLAMIAVITANVWKYYPFNMMLLMGGLQSISPALKEAAEIDGANGWQQFSRVTLPLLRPVMFVTVMLNIVHAFNAFTVVHVMTGGGPLRATEIFPLLIHRLGFVSLSFERASAAAGLLFLTVAFAISIYTWTFWKESEM